MAVEIETLEGLERKVVLSLPWEEIKQEVNKKLRETQKRVRLDGFRPGKTPLKIIENIYGQSIQHDILNDKAFKTFYEIVETEKIKIAGLKKLEVLPKDDAEEDVIQVLAIFEITPDNIELGDLSTKTIDKIVTEITENDINKTLEILRKQRVHYEPVTREAQKSDRVLIDFEGKIEDKAFEGGTAKNYSLVLGEGHMLPDFEQGIEGLKPGQSKEVEVRFPENYHGKEVAGKSAVFKITLKSLEKSILPEIDAEFAKSLGITDGDIVKMREEIKENLSREMARRVEMINKEAVINLLLESAEFELPSIMVDREIERLQEKAKQNFLKQGISKDNIPELPKDMFKEQAEKSVKVGLILNQIMDKESLVANKEQIQAVIEDIAKNYENPAEVFRYYLHNKEKYANVQSVATEKNIVEFILGKVKTNEVKKSFDELMKV